MNLQYLFQLLVCFSKQDVFPTFVAFCERKTEVLMWNSRSPYKDNVLINNLVCVREMGAVLFKKEKKNYIH